jgi:putative N6-adenine-specific DNA methylase
MEAFFAKTYKGLEALLAAELLEIGAQDIVQDFRGVHFKGDNATMYKANYVCRTALRILKKVAQFEIPDDKALYDAVYEIDWTARFNTDQTFCVDVVGTTDTLKNTQYTAVKAKDAIVDRFRAKYDKRPSINTDMPDCRIHLHIFKNQGTIYLDSSDASLHLRGYRKHLGKAPMSEVLAAGLVKLSKWDGEIPLIDPMCGSGTILLEAAMMAMHWPAQYFRKDFGFFRWNDFDNELWESVRTEYNDKRVMELKKPLLGFDQDPVMVRKAKENVITAHCFGDISIELRNFFELQRPSDSKGVLIFNPPYDDRLKLRHAADFFKKMSDVLKHEWRGYQAWILLPDTDDAKAFSLKPSVKHKVMNGPTPCTFSCFNLY